MWFCLNNSLCFFIYGLTFVTLQISPLSVEKGHLINHLINMLLLTLYGLRSCFSWTDVGGTSVLCHVHWSSVMAAPTLSILYILRPLGFPSGSAVLVAVHHTCQLRPVWAADITLRSPASELSVTGSTCCVCTNSAPARPWKALHSQAATQIGPDRCPSPWWQVDTTAGSSNNTSRLQQHQESSPWQPLSSDGERSR